MNDSEIVVCCICGKTHDIIGEDYTVESASYRMNSENKPECKFHEEERFCFTCGQLNEQCICVEYVGDWEDDLEDWVENLHIPYDRETTYWDIFK